MARRPVWPERPILMDTRCWGILDNTGGMPAQGRMDQNLVTNLARVVVALPCVSRSLVVSLDHANLGLYNLLWRTFARAEPKLINVLQILRPCKVRPKSPLDLKLQTYQ